MRWGQEADRQGGRFLKSQSSNLRDYALPYGWATAPNPDRERSGRQATIE